MSRSTLMKNLPFREADEEDDNPFEAMIDEILKEVAVYREPNLTGKGRTQLFVYIFLVTGDVSLKEISLICQSINSWYVFLELPWSTASQLILNDTGYVCIFMEGFSRIFELDSDGK